MQNINQKVYQGNIFLEIFLIRKKKLLNGIMNFQMIIFKKQYKNLKKELAKGFSEIVVKKILNIRIE